MAVIVVLVCGRQPNFSQLFQISYKGSKESSSMFFQTSQSKLVLSSCSEPEASRLDNILIQIEKIFNILWFFLHVFHIWPFYSLPFFRVKYIHLMVHFRMRAQIPEQMKACKRGILSIVNYEWLSQFYHLAFSSIPQNQVHPSDGPLPYVCSDPRANQGLQAWVLIHRQLRMALMVFWTTVTKTYLGW